MSSNEEDQQEVQENKEEDMQAIEYETERDIKENNYDVFSYEKQEETNEEKFKEDIIRMLKGSETSPSAITIILYIILIIMVMLFVFIPLLLIVFTVINDMLNQLLSTVAMAFVAFKRFSTKESTEDYTIGILLAQICWILYSMPVVTFCMYFAMKLVGFFFKVIKEQLFDFEYHKEYINKIKRWVVPNWSKEKETKEQLMNEVRPEEAKKLETLLYVLKEENHEKIIQLISAGIFALVVISYIICLIISLFDIVDIQDVFLGYTCLYLIFPAIGCLDCIIRSWRNVLVIMWYKYKNRQYLGNIRENEIKYNTEVEKYLINMKLFKLGIQNKPDSISKKIEDYKKAIDAARSHVTPVDFPSLTFPTTWLIKHLYKIKIFEMVYPNKLLGMDDFGKAIQDNTPFLGDFPFVRLIALTIGFIVKVVLFSRDASRGKRDANSYYPYSIIITLFYLIATPYILIMSKMCGTYSMLKWSKKQKAEKIRKIKLYTEIFKNKVHFIVCGKEAKEDQLKTAWELYKDEIAEKKKRNGVIFNEIDEDEEEDDDDNDNNDNDQEDDENKYEFLIPFNPNEDEDDIYNENNENEDKKGAPISMEKIEEVIGATNIDDLIEGGSISSAATLVQVLYAAVMIIVIFCGFFVLSWRAPSQRISHDTPMIYIPSTIQEGYFDPPKINESYCSVEINSLSITELAVLPIIPYYAYSDIPLEVRKHNINALIDLAFRRSKTIDTTFNMTELWCKDEEECDETLSDVASVLQVYVGGKLDYNILIPFGMRDKGDWVLVLEMFMQQFPNDFLGDVVPFYDFFIDILGDKIRTISATFQKICGVRSITIMHALRIKDIAEQLESDHNIAVGQTTGGYFAKYIGYMLRDRFSTIGFNSLSFKENALCGDYEGDEDDPSSIINVYTEAILEGEENIAFNYKHSNFDFGTIQTKIRPPNATDTFCHSVAECSSDQNQIDFCMKMLGKDRFIDNVMAVYGREWHSRDEEKENEEGE